MALSQEEQHALIEAHLQFAEQGAANYMRRFPHHDRDDILSAAYMGLVHAAKKFDPDKGFTFKTYAFNWCERYMAEVYREASRANGWTRAPTASEQKAGAKKFRMVRRMQRCEFPVIQTKEGEIEMGPDMLTSGDPSPETLLLYQEKLDQDAAALSAEHAEYFSRCTTDRQRDVVQAWCDGLSLRETGERLGVSRARICQIASDIALPSFRYRPERDEPSVAPEQKDAVLVNGKMTLPDARAELERMLMAVPIEGVVSYEALAGAIGCDTTRARGLLTTVRQKLLAQHQMIFGSIPHLGLRRLPDDEVLKVGARSVKSVGRAAIRGMHILSAVKNFNELPNEQKVAHNTMMAQFGMLAHVVSEKVTKQIEARAAAPLPMTAMLEAIKDNL